MKGIKRLKKNQNEKRKNGSIVRSNSTLYKLSQCNALPWCNRCSVCGTKSCATICSLLIAPSVLFCTLCLLLLLPFTLRTAVKGGAESVRLRAKSSEEGNVITPLPHCSTATAFVECVNSVANFH